MKKRNLVNGQFRKTLKDKRCAHCGKFFHPRNKYIKTCSKQCGYKYRTIPLTDEVLHKRSIALKKIKRTKQWRSKISKALKGNKNGRYNSGKIKLKMRGENHPNWKGGIGRHSRDKDRTEYKNWRKAVFERDNYKCQARCCDGNTTKIVAHHKVFWIKNVELRFDINNGITLCVDCHRRVHKIIGNGQKLYAGTQAPD